MHGDGIHEARGFKRAQRTPEAPVRHVRVQAYAHDVMLDGAVPNG